MKEKENKKQSELQIQAECWQWAWNKFPKQLRRKIYSINNNPRNVIHGTQMQAAGCIAGILDMFILLPKQRIIWIEFKTDTGVLSKDQKKFISILNDLGHIHYIVRSFEQFQSIIYKHFDAE